MLLEKKKRKKWEIKKEKKCLYLREYTDYYKILTNILRKVLVKVTDQFRFS